MKIKSELVLLVLIVVDVKGECDTYLECLGSFFDHFFLGHTNFNFTKASDIAVPGFDTLNVEKENLKNILSGVSSFLEEELESDISYGSPINILQNVNNNTAIYVKTITIVDNSDNNDDDIAVDSDSFIKTIESFDSSNTKTTDLVKPLVNLNITKIVTINNNNYTVVNEKSSNKQIDDKLKQNVNENEIPDVDDYGIYYDNNDNTTDYPIIDYIDLYKDTTNEYIDIKPTPTPEHFNENKYGIETVVAANTITHENDINNGSHIGRCTSTEAAVDQIVFPWVTAIFIKNNTSNQFDYYCDGALLSDNVVLTAARCIQNNEMQVKPEDLLVLLGKTSLYSMNDYEIVAKVKDAITHDNYTMHGYENDIAILVMEDPVVFNERIQAACLGIEDYKESITTGWASTGELTLLTVNAGEMENSNDIRGNRTYTAVYGNDIKVCPSHGALHVARDTGSWHLHGIRHANPNDRGFCFDNTMTFTDLNYYINWIKQYV